MKWQELYLVTGVLFRKYLLKAVPYIGFPYIYIYIFFFFPKNLPLWLEPSKQRENRTTWSWQGGKEHLIKNADKRFQTCMKGSQWNESSGEMTWPWWDWRINLCITESKMQSGQEKNQALILGYWIGTFEQGHDQLWELN